MKITEEYSALRLALRQQGMAECTLRKSELASAQVLKDCGFHSAEEARRVAAENGRFTSKRRARDE